MYRRATLRRAKGWGKDPVGSVLAVLEAIGPCRFGGWALGGEHARDFGVDVDYTYSAGEPIVVPNPAGWVQVAAVSREQTRTTMRLFPGSSRRPPGSASRSRCTRRSSISVRPVGDRGDHELAEVGRGPAVHVRDPQRIQNWLATNDGHEMAEVVDGNLTKSRDGAARALSMCNAHVPGQDSVGEREWDAWQAIEQGRSRATDVLYDALEAPPDTELADEASLRRGLVAARGDSTWLDVDRHVAEIYDPRTRPPRPGASSSTRSSRPRTRGSRPGVRPSRPTAGAAARADGHITLGFDGSKTDDHSALMACRVTDGAMFGLGVWDPAEHGGEAPRDQIDGKVRWAFGTYDVVGFFSDLEGWESYVDRWDEELGRERNRELLVKASPKHRIAWDIRARGREFTLEAPSACTTRSSRAPSGTTRTPGSDSTSTTRDAARTPGV